MFRTRDSTTLLTLWKALILPIIDYCSQLWAPHKQDHIMQLEALQRTFTSSIQKPATTREGENLNYWQRLAEFDLYSIERRMERYHIIYTWKILEGQITPPKTDPIKPATNQDNPRTGRKCAQLHLPSESSARVKTLQHHSISRKGARLFNHLPKHLRNTTNVKLEVFKRELDKFLSTLPDQPGISGYTTSRPASSNSITDQLDYKHQNDRWRLRRGLVSHTIEGATLP